MKVAFLLLFKPRFSKKMMIYKAENTVLIHVLTPIFTKTHTEINHKFSSIHDSSLSFKM